VFFPLPEFVFLMVFHAWLIFCCNSWCQKLLSVETAVGISFWVFLFEDRSGCHLTWQHVCLVASASLLVLFGLVFFLCYILTKAIHCDNSVFSPFLMLKGFHWKFCYSLKENINADPKEGFEVCELLVHTRLRAHKVDSLKLSEGLCRDEDCRSFCFMHLVYKKPLPWV